MGRSRVPCAFLDHLVEFVFGWKVLRFALRRASLGPTCDQFELFGSESLIVAEIAETLYGAPGGHATLQDFFFDGRPPRECFAIFHQRESSSPFTMTCDAVRIEDAGNLSIPSNGSSDDVMGGQYNRKGDDQQTEQQIQ